MNARSSRIDSARPAWLAATWVVAALVWSCSSSATTDSISSGQIASIEVTPATSSLAIGAQLPLSALARDPDGKIVSDASLVWSVKDSTIAKVSPTGVVTGIGLGTTQVAASASGKSGIAAITVQKTPVASLIVRPNHVDAVPGMHTQLTAVAYDAGNNILADRAVIWTTSNSDVATVDATGTVTAVAPGTATITGTAEGKSDAAAITVTQAPVATVAVTPNPLGMSVGQKTQLTATLRDSIGNTVTGRAVAWTSSNTSVATVSDSGVVTAVAAGTTTITATSEGKSGTTAVTVSNFAVGSVSVQPQNNSIDQGSSVQLSVTVKDVNGSVVTNRVVTWTSSNTSVATVSQAGLVTGVSAGTATITATSEGVAGSTGVTVKDPVASVTVQPTSTTIAAGQTTTLTATTKDASGTVLTGQTVTWTTSDANVATVSASGVVTGIGAGTATITATSGGKTGTATVTVTPAAVGSVTVQPSSASVTVGQSTTLTATVKDVNGNVVTRTVSWSSSNTSVATVTQAGVVTGVASGTATITATADGVSGTASVSVSLVPVATVTVQPSTATISVGQTVTLSATTKDANGNVLTGRTVTWSSSNTSIATVSSTGVVTGVAAGTATITATSEGKTGTSTVTVTSTPVGSVTVSPSSTSVAVGKTVQLTAVVKDINGTIVTDRTVTWTSSNTSVATVSATGLVTGVAAGSVTITATSETKSGTSSVTVTPPPVASVTVQPSVDTILQTQTVTFTAILKDANGNILTGRTVTWSSSNTSVATINSAGTATGVAPGTVTITATSEGQSGTASLHVNPPPLAPIATITVSPASASIKRGSTKQFTATAKDASGNILTGRTFTWTSSNPNVATVDQSGVVTGISEGNNVVITASAELKSGTALVTVTK